MLRLPVRTRACSGAEAGAPSETPPATQHVRRPRYAGNYPRSFAEKHKERAADPVVVANIERKGNTAVGTHRCAPTRVRLAAASPLSR